MSALDDFIEKASGACELNSDTFFNSEDEDAARQELAELRARAAEPKLTTFCKAYDVWLAACSDGWGHNDRRVNTIRDARLLITKSSLLARLVYGGEELRTEKCPTHKGVWCGIPTKPEHDCCHMTGWIAKKGP